MNCAKFVTKTYIEKNGDDDGPKIFKGKNERDNIILSSNYELIFKKRFVLIVTFLRIYP